MTAESGVATADSRIQLVLGPALLMQENGEAVAPQGAAHPQRGGAADIGESHLPDFRMIDQCLEGDAPGDLHLVLAPQLAHDHAGLVQVAGVQQGKAGQVIGDWIGTHGHCLANRVTMGMVLIPAR